jgi:serine/threonine-protein kinase RsbW
MNTRGRVGPPACAFDPERLVLALDLLIASRIEAISPTVSKIMTLIKKTSCAPEHDFGVETALQEALANAVLHGNHLDPGKMVRICCACQKDRGVVIIVKDEGEGFDATKVPSPLVGERIHSEHGRGIYLVNTLMDEVRFERGGREIYMRKGKGGSAVH